MATANHRKLTPEVQASIVAAIESGGTYRDAALCAGISESGLRLWRTAGLTAKSGKPHDLVSAISGAYARRRARLTEALDRWRPAGSASLPRLPMPTLHERGGETLRQFVAAMAAPEARARGGETPPPTETTTETGGPPHDRPREQPRDGDPRPRRGAGSTADGTGWGDVLPVLAALIGGLAGLARLARASSLPSSGPTRTGTEPSGRKSPRNCRRRKP